MKHDIWSATPPRNDVLKLADLPVAPETYDEFYDRLDLQVERIPSLKVILVDKTNSRFSESLADVVGRTTIRGHYTPSIRTENDFSDKFDPIESLNIYIYISASQSEWSANTGYEIKVHQRVLRVAEHPRFGEPVHGRTHQGPD
ncbi:hypothetical protein ACFQJ7_06095 [Halovenus rubra]|uniref:Uncharacterized protein n=2 Tax=Halovenus rubra TaxID=869890 RepID=A0ACC7E038_9EURY|nr:hypothetical protein [Halovenus rubra]